MFMKIQWNEIKKYSDIKFELYNGVAKITINRPKVYNAFRPETNIQMLEAFDACRERNDVDVVVLTVSLYTLSICDKYVRSF